MPFSLRRAESLQRAGPLRLGHRPVHEPLRLGQPCRNFLWNICKSCRAPCLLLQALDALLMQVACRTPEACRLQPSECASPGSAHMEQIEHELISEYPFYPSGNVAARARALCCTGAGITHACPANWNKANWLRDVEARNFPRESAMSRDPMLDFAFSTSSRPRAPVIRIRIVLPGTRS